MDRNERLKELFAPVFEQNNVKLYDLSWTRIGRDQTLQVAIMKPDGTMDLDTCAIVSDALSEILDREDPIVEEYTLEVCSPGAEREIKDLDELNTMAGEYVFVRLKHPFKKMLELTGEILEVNDDTVILEYRDKAVKRKADFTKDNIDFIRLAVRI